MFCHHESYGFEGPKGVVMLNGVKGVNGVMVLMVLMMLWCYGVNGVNGVTVLMVLKTLTEDDQNKMFRAMFESEGVK
jgi:hypothetical protein